MLMQAEPIYKSAFGALFCADSLEFMRQIDNDSVDLVLTSPPYALHFKKEYGNANQQDYIAWLLRSEPRWRMTTWITKSQFVPLSRQAFSC